MSWARGRPIDEIGDSCSRFAQAGPDSVYWLGSATFPNRRLISNRKRRRRFWANHNSATRRGSAIPRRSPASPYLGLWRDYQQLHDIRNSNDHFDHGAATPPSARRFRSAYPRRERAQPRQHEVIAPRMTRTAAHATGIFACVPHAHRDDIWHALAHF